MQTGWSFLETFPMSPSETIHVQREDRTAWVTLDRPPLNILDISAMKELSSVLDRVLSEIDFLVFRGAGPKAFSAGAEVRDHTPDRVADMLAAFHGVFRRIVQCDCITIAAVHGHCLGGGMELAAICDFVVASESAKFGQPEIKLGCFPPVALVTLPHVCGLRAALDLILSGRTISAREAQALGLVTRVVPDDQLATCAGGFLGELRAVSPAIIRMTHRTLTKAWREEFEAKLAAVEQVYLGELMNTEDAREGIRAFLEKRAPVWQGH
jgi:cyclohexa-1,5-dienecarbonyl-CoA hydratase